MVGARLLTGVGSYVDILLQGAAAGPGPKQEQASSSQQQQNAAAINSLRIAVDKRKAGGFTQSIVEGGPVPLPGAFLAAANSANSTTPSTAPGAAGETAQWFLPGKTLTLDVFVDHNILEVYALDGLGRVTSRVYPADEGIAWGLAVFGVLPGGGTAALKSAEVWSMDNAWVGSSPLC